MALLTRTVCFGPLLLVLMLYTAAGNARQNDSLLIPDDKPANTDEDSCMSILACLGSTVNVTEEGTICLPAFGTTNYLNNLDCSWRVSAPIGSVARLEFAEMDTEECSSCSCDYVSVHDGPDIGGDPLAKLCGANRGTFYYSRYQDLFIHFYSDHTFNAQGFKVKVTFIPTPRIAFHAARITSLDAISESVKVMFHVLTVNDGQAFDIESSEFTCPASGPYFFSISAGAAPRKAAQLILRKNGFSYVSLVRTSAEPTGVEMTSRSVIMELEEGDVMDVLLFRYTSVYSDDDRQISFSGFHLPFVNEHDAALFVARPDNLTVTSGDYIDGLEKRIVNIGDWGNDAEHMYMYRPHDGVYYDELTAGLGEITHVRLYANSLYSSAFSGAFGSENYKTVSLCHMSESSSEDFIRMYSAVTTLQTNSELQIAISSFILAPVDRPRPYFRAYRTAPTSTTGNIPFTIEISQDIGFTESNGTFRCLVPGTYFVHVSIGTAYTTSVSYVSLVSVTKNGQSLAMLTRYITDELYDAHMSRNIIVELDVGDELNLRLVEGYVHSTSGRRTTFSAFLLYEDVEYLMAKQQGSHPELSWRNTPLIIRQHSNDALENNIHHEP